MLDGAPRPAFTWRFEGEASIRVRTEPGRPPSGGAALAGCEPRRTGLSLCPRIGKSWTASARRAAGKAPVRRQHREAEARMGRVLPGADLPRNGARAAQVHDGRAHRPRHAPVPVAPAEALSAVPQDSSVRIRDFGPSARRVSWAAGNCRGACPATKEGEQP